MNLDKLLDQISKLDLESNKKISKYLDKFKNAGKVVKEKSIKELELNKLKVEFAKKKFNLGAYISTKYLADKILDFSYDEEFKLMMEEIVSLKKYIDSIESSWIL